MLVPFKDLAVGSTFTFNGNLCVKQSTRTGKLIAVEGQPWFYFGMSDIVREV
jgi:hypothetical protein